MFRRRPVLTVCVITLGIVLRLLFVLLYPSITDDSRVYSDLGTNLYKHHLYGYGPAVSAIVGYPAPLTQVVPVDSRLPGYPALLALLFMLFGAGNYMAVFLCQVALDLGTCILIADVGKRIISERAGYTVFVLSAFCPFLANYTAVALTETLETFATALVLECTAGGITAVLHGQKAMWWWIGAGVSTAGCIMIRPDGGIVLISVLLFLLVAGWFARTERARVVAIGMAAGVVTTIALLPLVPWTLRNVRTMHHLQMLAPRYATTPGMLEMDGFNRWVRTWIGDYASVVDLYWAVPGSPIEARALPGRAFDSEREREVTLQLISEYNVSTAMTSELDMRFAALAAERVRRHPFRYYFSMPGLRIADMWLRPRTEMMFSNTRWWRFTNPIVASVTVGLGLLNLFYLGAASVGLLTRRISPTYLVLLLTFVVLRSGIVAMLVPPEPRYVLECYPVALLLAATAFDSGVRQADEQARGE